MERLNMDLLKKKLNINEEDYREESLPEKVIQFGQGNFLRGYIDWFIHQMNKRNIFNGKVVVVQPFSQGPTIPLLNEQDGLYTVVLRGIQNGKVVDHSEIVSSISRGLNAKLHWKEVLKVAESPDLELIFSNTTEAGITYVKEDYQDELAPHSFPGKLTAFLYHRFKVLNGSRESGLIIVPCELIEDNGTTLKAFVQQIAEDWQLPQPFKEWLDESNYFCNTLVDRIVTGFPKENVQEFNHLLGYKDHFITIGEPYHLFAVDSDQVVQERFPLHKAGLNVKWGDITPHRELKVRLLNGPHTMMFAASYLSGLDTVRETMEDETLRLFVEQGFVEIMPTVTADSNEKDLFVSEVKERFLNPYNKHYLTDIGLNACYKFKSRLLPSLHDYVHKKNRLPEAIVFSLAALIVYYRPISREANTLIGNRNGEEYTMRDHTEVIDALTHVWSQYGKGEKELKDLIYILLGNRHIWGEDLNVVNGLTDRVMFYLGKILSDGMKESVKSLIQRTVNRKP